jgi:hypothetical protein
MYQSTGTFEKRDAAKVLTRAENKVLEGKQETPRTHRTKFDNLIDDFETGLHAARVEDLGPPAELFRPS